MIVKMKFINISGPRNDIDRVTDLYLSRYEIQLESALSELKTVDNLRPFVEINPYKDALGKAEEFAGSVGGDEGGEVRPAEGLDAALDEADDDGHAEEFGGGGTTGRARPGLGTCAPGAVHIAMRASFPGRQSGSAVLQERFS